MLIFQETSIDSVPDDVPPHPVDEHLDDLAEEGEEELEEVPEVISPEKSPREGATSAAPPPETATSKLRFDEFLNLMEVF